MGKSKKPKVEVTEYFMSQHFGICVAADAIRRIVVKEKDAWSGYVTSLSTIEINKDDLFGGVKKEGGVEGVVYFLPGASDQILPDSLAVRLGRADGLDCPGYRGLCTAFFVGENGLGSSGSGGGGSIIDIIAKLDPSSGAGQGGFYWSANSPYLPGVWIEVERAPIGLNPDYAFCGGPAGPSAAICIVIDRSSQVNHGTVLQTLKDGIVAYLEYLKVLVAGGRLIDLEVRRLYSTTVASTYRSASVADVDDAIAFINATITASGIICDWRPAATGAKGFFDATDGDILDRQLKWCVYGSAGFQFMADDAALTINSISPLPTISVFNCHDADTSDGELIDNTAADGVPVFSDGEGEELGDAIIGPVAEGGGPRRDANPAHMIYECLTNTDWGMGSPSTAIDVDSFNDAAITLYGENFCLSMIWTRQAAIQKFVQEILDHIQAVLFVDPRTGLLTLKLIRADYVEADLPILTPQNAILSNFGRKLWGEIVNEIVVTWTNPDNEQDETVIVQDLASIVTQGGIISDGRNYYGVRNSGLAQKLASRDLRTSGAPLAACEAEVNRELWFLRPASVVKVNWPEDGFSNIIMRVVNVNYGKPGDMTLKLSLLEDVFGLDAGDYIEPPTTGWIDPSTPPEPIAIERIFTLPLFFAAGTEASSFIDDPTYPEVLAGVLATVDNDDTVEIELWDEVSLPDSSLEWQNLATLNVIGRAELVNDVPAEDVSILDELVNFTGQTGPIQGGFAIIGDGAEDENEIVLITAVGEDVTVDRGVLDTVPRAWPAGTPIWFVDQNTSFEDPTVRSAGETVSYKLLPRTSQGLLPLADASLVSYELTERPWLPNRPADVIAYGAAFTTIDDMVDASARADPWVTIEWANRNRLLEDTVVLSWTDASVDPEDGQTTKLTVLKLDGTTVVTTHSGLTGTSFDIPDASFGSEYEVIVRASSERTDVDGTFESLQFFDHYVRVETVIEGVDASSGVGAASFVGAGITDGALSASGVAGASFLSNLVQAGALSAAGVGAEALAGAIAGDGVFSGSGVGAAAIVGTTPSGISYVGGNKLAIAPSNSGSLSLTALTGGSDSAPVQNDYVVVTWSRGFNSDINMALTSAGYTELADLYADDNTDANLGVYIKKMGAVPDTTVDVAAIGAAFGGVLIAEVYRGVDLTTPMDVAVQTATGANSALANPPSITPVTTGAMIVTCGSAGAQSGTGDNASNFASSDMTVFQTTFAAFTNGGMGHRAWTSGAYDPAAWTCADNIRSSWAAVTLALRPA